MTTTVPTRFVGGVFIGALLALPLALGGCQDPLAAPPSTSASAADDIAVESRYPWGTGREDVEKRYGAARVVWVMEHTPDDEFAAATMREMIAAKKPRPAYYQVFATRRLDGRGYFKDYVFYNTQNRVVYAVRRS
jgi:hypothetical protein